jgi:hypothetical protein
MTSPINPSNDIDDDLICASSTAKPIDYRSLARGDPAHVRAHGQIQAGGHWRRFGHPIAFIIIRTIAFSGFALSEDHTFVYKK